MSHVYATETRGAMDDDNHNGAFLLRPRDVAATLGKSQTYVYWLIRRGTLPAIRLGPKAIRVKPEDLAALLKRWEHG